MYADAGGALKGKKGKGLWRGCVVFVRWRRVSKRVTGTLNGSK